MNWNIQRGGGSVYVSVQQPRPFLFPIFRFLPPNDFGQYFSHRRVFLFIAYTLTDSFGTTVTQKLCILYCVFYCKSAGRRLFLFIAYTLTDSFGTTVTQKLCTLYCVLHCKSAGRRLHILFTWFCVSSAFRSCPCRRRPR